MHITRCLAGGALALAAGSAALGFGPGEASGIHGRITPTAVAQAGLRYALANSTIESASLSRIDVYGNSLVDFGAHIDGDLGTGYDVHVLLNFEPGSGGTRIGDIEAHVKVSYGGTPLGMLSIQNPASGDDTTIPTNGPDVTSVEAYAAVEAAYADSNVASLLTSRFAAGRKLYGTQTTWVGSDWMKWTVDVDCSFRNADGSNPPAGQREVWARVVGVPSMGLVYVDSYWTE